MRRPGWEDSNGESPVQGAERTVEIEAAFRAYASRPSPKGWPAQEGHGTCIARCVLVSCHGGRPMLAILKYSPTCVCHLKAWRPCWMPSGQSPPLALPCLARGWKKRFRHPRENSGSWHGQASTPNGRSEQDMAFAWRAATCRLFWELLADEDEQHDG